MRCPGMVRRHQVEHAAQQRQIEGQVALGQRRDGFVPVPRQQLHQPRDRRRRPGRRLFPPWPEQRAEGFRPRGGFGREGDVADRQAFLAVVSDRGVDIVMRAGEGHLDGQFAQARPGLRQVEAGTQHGLRQPVFQLGRRQRCHAVQAQRHLLHHRPVQHRNQVQRHRHPPHPRRPQAQAGAAARAGPARQRRALPFPHMPALAVQCFGHAKACRGPFQQRLRQRGIGAASDPRPRRSGQAGAAGRLPQQPVEAGMLGDQRLRRRVEILRRHAGCDVQRPHGIRWRPAEGLGQARQRVIHRIGGADQLDLRQPRLRRCQQFALVHEFGPHEAAHHAGLHVAEVPADEGMAEAEECAERQTARCQEGLPHRRLHCHHAVLGGTLPMAVQADQPQPRFAQDGDLEQALAGRQRRLDRIQRIVVQVAADAEGAVAPRQVAQHRVGETGGQDHLRRGRDLVLREALRQRLPERRAGGFRDVQEGQPLARGPARPGDLFEAQQVPLGQQRGDGGVHRKGSSSGRVQT